jgi:hypothetical protein
VKKLPQIWQVNTHLPPLPFGGGDGRRGKTKKDPGPAAEMAIGWDGNGGGEGGIIVFSCTRTEGAKKRVPWRLGRAEKARAKGRERFNTMQWEVVGGDPEGRR